MTPHRFTSTTRRHACQSPARIELPGPIPALFISTATGPKAEVAAFSSASTSASLLTSVGAASTPFAPFGEAAASFGRRSVESLAGQVGDDDVEPHRREPLRRRQADALKRRR
jgi:hypothetical protein